MKIEPVSVVSVIAGGALAASLVSWPIAVSAAASSEQDQGKALFVNAGCAACHGNDARGTQFAPTLPGHTAEQVRRYVRNPQGKMPRFGADKLNDAELGRIASYIAGLPVPKLRVASVDLRGAIEMHHWMAHHALRSKDAKHGIHHLSHALDVVKEDEHRRGIESIIELVRKNRLEEAAHHTVVMVTTKISPDISMEQMHLRLALGSLDAADAKEALHHVDHYVESVSAHDKAHAMELAEVLKKGQVDAARKRLAHLLAR